MCSNWGPLSLPEAQPTFKKKKEPGSKAFDLFDTDQSGEIDLKELKAI